jgi:hypothetical protein
MRSRRFWESVRAEDFHIFLCELRDLCVGLFLTHFRLRAESLCLRDRKETDVLQLICFVSLIAKRSGFSRTRDDDEHEDDSSNSEFRLKADDLCASATGPTGNSAPLLHPTLTSPSWVLGSNGANPRELPLVLDEQDDI